jgi:hydroxyethylthiazole kinase-like uncharacterized protein yjeF
VPTARSTEQPPLPGATPLFGRDAMRAADAAASEAHAMPSILLMERAGRATAELILARHAGRDAAIVVAGRGNNGGDGLVVARQLADAGWRVRVIAPGGIATTGDAATMGAIATSLGIAIEGFDARTPHDPEAVVVDALLGTGASGAPRGALAEAVAWIARAPGPVVSCDVPSGVDADSGRVPGTAVRADLTVTYHGDMVGLRVAPGRAHAGRVEVVAIGVPAAVGARPAAWLAGRAVVAGIPRKEPLGEKYGAGAVLLAGGGVGMSGAICLSAEAALRAGAGLAVAVVPRAIQPVCAATVREVMFLPAAGDEELLGPGALETIRAQAGRVGALAIGPGVGRESRTGAVVRAVLDELELPTVIDADALWHLGERPSWLRDRAAPVVLTPHAGEGARILGVERAEVEAGRLEAAQELAELTGAVVVLKGAGTLTCAPGATPIVNDTGGASLATAGSGDVLTGVVAALLAKGLDARVAAAGAVALHGLAGELTGAGDGTVAGDVLAALPRARAGT